MQETRKIRLTNEELLFAIESYCRVNKNFLPAGKIVSCKPLNGESVCVSIIKADTAQGVDFNLKLPSLIRPVARYCIENNVSLPVGGERNVSIVDGDIVLCVVLRMSNEVCDDYTNMSAGNL